MATETPPDHLTESPAGFRRASEIARRQFWSISRSQLLDVGVTASQVTSWIARGILFPRDPGLYAFARPELPLEGELGCGLLFAGPGSALTGLTRLWWRGYLHRRPTQIHIDAPGKRRSRQDLRTHHPAEISRSVHRGLPLAGLPRSLLLATTALSRDSLRLVLARADYARELSLLSLQSALDSAPRGATALRAAMDSHLPQLAACVNRFERDFVLLCESHSLPIPEPNVRIGRYRPDMLWREQRLIVELDGDDAHSSAAQLASDARRQAHLESLGYVVLRFSWDEITLTPEKVAATVRACL